MGEEQVVRAIGRVKNRMGRHILIVECEAAKLPRLYSKILDKHWKPVGKLVDIFGDVASPLAAVWTNTPDPEQLIGERLFMK